jgi:transposase
MEFLTSPRWKAIGITETATGLLVQAELLTDPSDCPHCDASPKWLRHYGVTTLLVKDIPQHFRPVEISLTRRRYFCSVCRGTSLQPITGVAERQCVTDRLIRLATQRAFRTPLKVVAAELGLSVRFLSAIVSEEVARLERKPSCDAPRVLDVRTNCLFERERLLLTAVEARRVISITTGAGQESVAQALSKLQGPGKVEIVTLPLSRHLWDAARQILPWAKASVDRFSVMELGSEALEAVRERLRSCSPRLKDEKALLATAWALKARFIDVFRTDSSLEARRRYSEWAATVPKELEFAFGPLVRTVEAWSEEIFCYFDHFFAPARSEATTQLRKSLPHRGHRVSPQKNGVARTRDIITG